MHRLLEGALGEVGGDCVGEADQEGAGGAGERGEVAEGGEGREGGEDGDGDGEATEALDEADPEALVQGDDDRVRTERIALVQQLRGVAFGETVGGQEVLGHVGVEASAEDPEMAFDGEWERGGEERPKRHRPAKMERLL